MKNILFLLLLVSFSAFGILTPGGGGGGGGGSPGGGVDSLQYNAGSGNFGGDAATTDGAGNITVTSLYTAGEITGGSVSSAAFDVEGAGVCTIQLPNGGATTYNFNMPNTAGTSGYALTSGGGGSSPMTWTQFQAAGNYITALTGDVTASGAGSAAATLATVNSNTGSFGSSSSIPSFTVNGKGLITGASGNAVVAPAGTLSGTALNSSVVTSSLSALGTVVTGIWNGTAIAAAYVANLTNASSQTLSGYASGSGTISSSDTPLTAIQKLNGNIAGISSGVTTIGTIDSGTASANGSSISGSSLLEQSASATKPGLVNNTTQTFSGAKTFSSTIQGPSATNAGAPTVGSNGNNYGLFINSTGSFTGLTSTSQVSLITNSGSNSLQILSTGVNATLNQNTNWFMGGTWKSITTPVSNPNSSSAGTLMTYTLADANQVINGDRVKLTVWGIFAANITAKTVICYYGTATAATITLSATASGGSWRIEGEAVRTGATSQVLNFNATVDSTNAAAFPAQNFYGTSAQTLASSTIQLYCTGQAGATNDIVQEYMSVDYGANGN